MNISITADDIKNIKDKGVLRLLQVKADKAVLDCLEIVKNDPLGKSPVVAALIGAIEQAEAIRIASVPVPRKRRKKADPKA